MDTNEAWASDIRRTRHIGDFREWKDHALYTRAFNRLLRDLKAVGKTWQRDNNNRGCCRLIASPLSLFPKKPKIALSAWLTQVADPLVPNQIPKPIEVY